MAAPRHEKGLGENNLCPRVAGREATAQKQSNFLAEELQTAQAKRRIACRLYRQKEEPSQSSVWRKLTLLVGLSGGPEAHQLLGM